MLARILLCFQPNLLVEIGKGWIGGGVCGVATHAVGGLCGDWIIFFCFNVFYQSIYKKAVWNKWFRRPCVYGLFTPNNACVPWGTHPTPEIGKGWIGGRVCGVATHAVGGLCGDSGYFLFVSICFIKAYWRRPSEINGLDDLTCMDCFTPTNACVPWGTHTTPEISKRWIGGRVCGLYRLRLLGCVQRQITCLVAMVHWFQHTRVCGVATHAVRGLYRLRLLKSASVDPAVGRVARPCTR